MLKRLQTYFKERYQLIPMLGVACIVFLEIYFIILLNQDVTQFQLGIQEAVGALTVFSFLMWLRVADDIKDFETDKQLFPDRPLPSGRVFVRDVMIFCTILQLIVVILNMLFMNNHLFFVVLYVYGYLMSKWFFQRSKIQPSLPLALVTHNPVQAIINLYIISFTVIKYGLAPITLTNVMALWTLYFPALIWEIARKIKAPDEENDYTTYSKLFGYKRSTRFILILTIVDIITNFILVINLNKVSVLVLFILVSWMVWKFIQFMNNPKRFVLVQKVERYTVLQEATMLMTVVVYLLFGKI